MPGITDLDILLSTMQPLLQDGDYIFSTFPNTEMEQTTHLKPVGCFHEKEGLTLIIKKEIADKYEIKYTAVFSLISLTIHSSLEAVGLTAAISTQLAKNGISANVVAAFYHDHIFIPKEQIQSAMNALNELQKEQSKKVNN